MIMISPFPRRLHLPPSFLLRLLFYFVILSTVHTLAGAIAAEQAEGERAGADGRHAPAEARCVRGALVNRR